MRYQELLDQAIGEPPPSTVDVDQVVRRQRRAARLRPVVAGLAAVALVAIGAGLTLQIAGVDPEPAVPPLALGVDSLAGFPEYQEGTRVVAAADAPIADGTLTLTITPTTLDLVLFSRCDSEALPSHLVLYAEFSVGDVSREWSFCPTVGVLGDDWADWDEFWAATGIAVGEPVTITVTPTKVRPVAGGGEPPLPSAGTLALAVAERVPFEEYEFPPAPDVPAPLPETPVGVTALLRASSTDPNQPVEATMTWDEDLAGCGPAGEGSRVFPLELLSQTPGSLRVLINDVPVADQAWWDFDQAVTSHALDVGCGEFDHGDEVTITAHPEHMTGDWQVRINGHG